MGNWNFHKKGFFGSWYNIKNLPEDDFEKKYNRSYQKNGDKYFRKIFHLGWMSSRSDKTYSLEYVNEYNGTRLAWVTKNYGNYIRVVQIEQ